MADELRVDDGRTITRNLVVATGAIPTIQADPLKARAIAWAQLDFRYFTRFWWFIDQETGVPRKLGDVLWAGQEHFIQEMKESDWVYALKARKLGFTTIEQAYDGWVARFGMQNARVHLFSRRDDAAKELLRSVKYGLGRLPEWMRLPYGKDSSQELHLVAGEDDLRIIKAYPADEDTAVEATCNHGHVDEWARMNNPRRVWQALEPSMAGSCHIITTGMGPGNYSSTYWMMTMAGDTRFKPFFVKATMRPDRSEAWVLAKRKSMPESDARQEYPMTWKDSLYAGVHLVFAGESLNECGATGPSLEVLRSDAADFFAIKPDLDTAADDYVKAWDIGRHRDAAVCVTWDFNVEPPEIVAYRRMRQKPYPVIQAEIEDLHERIPGFTVIEKNNAGEAVMENLDIDEDELDGHNTTASSKPRMIKKLEVAVHSLGVAYDARTLEQFHAEMEIYQLPDTNIVQDSVMAASIGYDWWTNPKRKRAKKKGKARVVQL